MKNLKMDRPVAVFDLETTGIDPDKDRIVQIAIIRVEPDGRRTTFETMVNPEVPIPPEATKVHGIKDSDVQDKPTFSQIRKEVEEYLKDAALAGFNSINFFKHFTGLGNPSQVQVSLLPFLTQLRTQAL